MRTDWDDVSKAGSYKCIYCETCWPQSREYNLCPSCREETRWCARNPLAEADAARAARSEEFGWWLLEQWLSDAVQVSETAEVH